MSSKTQTASESLQADDYGNLWKQEFVLIEEEFTMVYHHTVPSQSLPKLIYLHGLTGTGPRHISVFSRLADKFQIFLPSARGHGKSSSFPDGSFRLEKIVDDTAAFLSHVSPSEKVFLMGFSFGASTAARTARKYPELVRGLVLEDPPWKRKFNTPFVTSVDDPGPWMFFKISKAVRGMTDDEFETIKNNSPHSIMPKPEGPKKSEGLKGGSPKEMPNFPWLPSNSPFSQSMLEGLREFAVENIEKTFMEGAERYITEAVEGIQVPALLLTGEPGKAHCLKDVAQHTLQTWREGKEKNFPGAGHGMHNPPYLEEYLKVVADFFGSLD